jgi:mannose-6-phosphate isomerase
MNKISLLRNSIQNYAWGSTTKIPELLGEKNPGSEPFAELWMGAHPKAPSMANCDGKWISLQKLIDTKPREILGIEVAKRFNNKLPYLFKVLAAAKPLSIQAHPSLEQAKEGFARENRLGVPLDADNRNYKDDNHKPECICALSEFWALCGFRNISDIILMMRTICPLGLAEKIDMLEKNPNPEGLKQFYTNLMTMKAKTRKQIIKEAVQNAKDRSDEDNTFYWIVRIADEYPSDIGILSPILLNLIHLKPGQALFLKAGELHAYLKGLGMELMANSDNVLRGGLTPKHIDVPELLKALNFRSQSINILEGVPLTKNERVFETPAAEFVLSTISVTEEQPYQRPGQKSVEILMCIEGSANLSGYDNNENYNVKRGDSLIITAAAEGYKITGKAVFYKAMVPV